MDDFFSDKMLEIMKNRPRAVLSRSIGTPNFEVDYFLDLVKETKLKPLILEYNDKFVAKNKDKYHLCRMFFYRVLKNQNVIFFNTEKIINFNTEEGKIFSKIQTLWGENIIDFHHNLLYKKFPNLRGKIFDFSDWFNSTRYFSKQYYLYFLALFVCHGVLFENFLIGDKEESSFIKKSLCQVSKKLRKFLALNL